MKANSVVKDSFTTAADGKQYRGLFYNLDAIIPVECRANSCQATVRNYRIVQAEAKYLEDLNQTSKLVAARRKKK